MRPALHAFSVLVVLLASLAALSGCVSHSERTRRMRSALDAGDARRALDVLNRELGVRSEEHVPKKLERDDSLLLLNRASILQAVGKHRLSERDFQTADAAIDLLDLSHGTPDEIGRWVFSDSAWTVTTLMTLR